MGAEAKGGKAEIAGETVAGRGLGVEMVLNVNVRYCAGTR